jgi:hypothetical protein
MYVYNKLVIAVDKAYIDAGYENSAYKLELDRYQDQADRFKELLQEFSAGMLMDTDSIRPLLSYML